MRITLPLPPRELSPNVARRTHWATKSQAARAYRTEAWAAARPYVLGAKANGLSMPWKRATERATFYWPDRRRRDRDNAAASLKAVWDGLQDAGLLADDQFLAHLPARFAHDPARPRVEIEITPGWAHEEEEGS